MSNHFEHFEPPNFQIDDEPARRARNGVAELHRADLVVQWDTASGEASDAL